MLYKTKGIVFRFTPYSESTIIVSIFTELFGLQSYIVNGVRSKSVKSNKMALFQPLTLLDMVVYHKENANINRIKEYRCFYPYQHIPQNVVKSSIAIFINEILNKVVKDESHAAEVFEFISGALIRLDEIEKHVENFHLIFLVKLCPYLGFGAVSVAEILGPRYATTEEEKCLQQLMEADWNEDLRLTTALRRALLEHLLEFYRQHMETFGELRSINVLREVLE